VRIYWHDYGKNARVQREEGRRLTTEVHGVEEERGKRKETTERHGGKRRREGIRKPPTRERLV